MANGRSKSGVAGLSSSTTIPLGLAFAFVMVCFGGVWWLSNQSAKVDYLIQDGIAVRDKFDKLSTTVNEVKKTVDRIEWAQGADPLKKR